MGNLLVHLIEFEEYRDRIIETFLILIDKHITQINQIVPQQPLVHEMRRC
jgi:hypothetical protein